MLVHWYLKEPWGEACLAIPSWDSIHPVDHVKKRIYLHPLVPSYTEGTLPGEGLEELLQHCPHHELKIYSRIILSHVRMTISDVMMTINSSPINHRL